MKLLKTHEIRKSLLLSFFLIVFFPIFSQERTVGVWQLESAAYEGYTLFSPIANKQVYLIDNCGRVVHSWESSVKPGVSVYLQPDGSLYRAGQLDNPDMHAPGGGGVIEKFDWDGQLVWRYTYNSADYRAHHDFQVLPNGHVLILAWELKTKEICIENGRDPSLLSEEVLWPEHIIEVAPTGQESGEIVWEWHAWDHLIQDYDAEKPHYGIVSQHPEKIDINYVRPGKDGADWQHANSIYYHPGLDQIMLSVLYFDEIWIIDHNTSTEEASGAKGDLLFRWGNPQTYDAGTAADQKLFGQHSAHWIQNGLPDAGKVLLFNNGSSRPDGLFSSVVKLDLHMAEGAYLKDASNRFLPTDFYWEYRANPPSNFFSRMISGAQQLPNGNILIDDGAHGTFFEINPSLEEVWRYVSPVTIFGIAEQGDEVVNPSGEGTNLVFRATKYPRSYGAFIGRQLNPGDPIEINPDLTPCEQFVVEPSTSTPSEGLLVYPNPAVDQLFVKAYQGGFTLLDIHGKVVCKGHLSEQESIPLKNLSGGLYFLSLEDGTRYKLIIQ